jgi:hypothetical protein
MENEQGTGPAPPVSPACPAPTNEPRPAGQIRIPVTFTREPLNEVTGRGIHPLTSDPVDPDAGAELEIKMLFRTKLTALRHLPREQRAAASRAAREWLLLALKALAEKRRNARLDRRMLRRLHRPQPRRRGYDGMSPL